MPVEKTEAPKLKKPQALYNKCAACGLGWTDHPGISRTCHRLGEARSSLKAIQIWAMTPGALDPGDVVDLCRRTLTATEM